MKRITLIASLAATSILIIGCGGGSSSSATSTQTSTQTSAKISGTVPGTLIEAFCDNNYYSQVTSTQNGSNQHPFEIQVPTGTNCRLVMTTNENDPANRVITPIAFSNGSTIVLNADINLGNIPLELSYQNADDKDGDHVVDTALNINPNGASVNNNPVQDADGNGMVDSYDDPDDDNIPNAYEDNDHDGTPNLHDDDDGDGLPDNIDDDDHDGTNNNGNSNSNNPNDNDNERAGNSQDNESDGNDSNDNGSDDTN